MQRSRYALLKNIAALLLGHRLELYIYRVLTTTQ